MATVVNTTFKLKRGTAARWVEVNPILQQGEPGFEYDTYSLKIGDGVTPWNDLPYVVGKAEVVNFSSVNDFPTIGDENIIYKASNELSLYQFNPSTQTYEKLSDAVEQISTEAGIDKTTVDGHTIQTFSNYVETPFKEIIASATFLFINKYQEYL